MQEMMIDTSLKVTTIHQVLKSGYCLLLLSVLMACGIFFVTFASIFDSKLYSLIRSFHKATYPDWIQEHLP